MNTNTIRQALRDVFDLPLKVTQRATDTPDNPGGELHAIISDAKGHARISIVIGATADTDNRRADAVAAALNAFAEHGANGDAATPTPAGRIPGMQGQWIPRERCAQLAPLLHRLLDGDALPGAHSALLRGLADDMECAGGDSA